MKKHQEEEAPLAEDDFTVILADACYQNVACVLYSKYILIYFKVQVYL